MHSKTHLANKWSGCCHMNGFWFVSAGSDQSDCYEVTRILFVWKWNKNNVFTQQLGTVTSPLRLCTQNAYAILYQPATSVRCLHSNQNVIWQRRSLCQGWYRRLHAWQMEYSGDAFRTFLDLDRAIYLLVFIQNILSCVSKTNEALMDSERHGGKWKLQN